MEDPYLCYHIHILKHHSLTLPEFRSIKDEDKKTHHKQKMYLFSFFQNFFLQKIGDKKSNVKLKTIKPSTD